MSTEVFDRLVQQMALEQVLPFLGSFSHLFISAAGPESIALALEFSSSGSHGLLWTTTLVHLISLLSHSLTTRLGLVCRTNLLRVLRREYSPVLHLTFSAVLLLSSLIHQICLVMASAVGIRLITGIQIFPSIIIFGITEAAIRSSSRLQCLDQRAFQKFLGFVLSATCAILVIQSLMSQPGLTEAIISFLTPSVHPKLLLALIGAMGLSLSPHSLLLQSAMAAERSTDRNPVPAVREAGQALAYSFLYSSLLVISATATLQSQSLVSSSLVDGHILLNQVLNPRLTSTGFGLFLLCSSQLSSAPSLASMKLSLEESLLLPRKYSSAILEPLFSALAAILSLVVLAVAGSHGLQWVFVGAQVLQAMLLPFLMIPLLRVTSSSSVMGSQKNMAAVEVMAWFTSLLILALNISLLSFGFVSLTQSLDAELDDLGPGSQAGFGMGLWAWLLAGEFFSSSDLAVGMASASAWRDFLLLSCGMGLVLFVGLALGLTLWSAVAPLKSEEGQLATLLRRYSNEEVDMVMEDAVAVEATVGQELRRRIKGTVPAGTRLKGVWGVVKGVAPSQWAEGGLSGSHGGSSGRSSSGSGKSGWQALALRDGTFNNPVQEGGQMVGDADSWQVEESSVDDLLTDGSVMSEPRCRLTIVEVNDCDDASSGPSAPAAVTLELQQRKVEVTVQEGAAMVEGAGADESTLGVPVSAMDEDVCAGEGMLAVSAMDDGAGTDEGTLPVSAMDDGAGTDEGTLAVSAMDEGAGADEGTLPMSAMDEGAGADEGTLAVSAMEEGAGAGADELTVAASAMDTGGVAVKDEVEEAAGDSAHGMTVEVSPSGDDAAANMNLSTMESITAAAMDEVADVEEMGVADGGMAVLAVQPDGHVAPDHSAAETYAGESEPASVAGEEIEQEKAPSEAMATVRLETEQRDGEASPAGEEAFEAMAATPAEAADAESAQKAESGAAAAAMQSQEEGQADSLVGEDIAPGTMQTMQEKVDVIQPSRSSYSVIMATDEGQNGDLEYPISRELSLTAMIPQFASAAPTSTAVDHISVAESEAEVQVHEDEIRLQPESAESMASNTAEQQLAEISDLQPVVLPVPPTSREQPISPSRHTATETEAIFSETRSNGSLTRLSGLGRSARRQLAAALDDFWAHIYGFHGEPVKGNVQKSLKPKGSIAAGSRISTDADSMPGKQQLQGPTRGRDAAIAEPTSFPAKFNSLASLGYSGIPEGPSRSTPNLMADAAMRLVHDSQMPPGGGLGFGPGGGGPSIYSPQYMPPPRMGHMDNFEPQQSGLSAYSRAFEMGGSDYLDARAEAQARMRVHQLIDEGAGNSPDFGPYFGDARAGRGHPFPHWQDLPPYSGAVDSMLDGRPLLNRVPVVGGQRGLRNNGRDTEFDFRTQFMEGGLQQQQQIYGRMGGGDMQHEAGGMAPSFQRAAEQRFSPPRTHSWMVPHNGGPPERSEATLAAEEHKKGPEEKKTDIMALFSSCLNRLNAIEGCDWLFRFECGTDEDLIACVALRQKHLSEGDSGATATDPADIWGCGPHCLWSRQIIVSFGVWCVHRLLELSHMESRPELWGKYTFVLNRLQGTIDPAFFKPRTIPVLCDCFSNHSGQQPITAQHFYTKIMASTTPYLPPIEWPWTVGSANYLPDRYPDPNLFRDMIREVEVAIGCRKGRTGTTAGDVAFPKGKENLSSVLKRFKRRLSIPQPSNSSMAVGVT